MGSPDTRQLARDSLLGLAVGDALGAGSEGHSMLPTPIRDLTPPSGVVLRWTDDTQMAVSVVENLLQHGEIDQDRLAEAFAQRYDSRRGYGAGMHGLLNRLRQGADWREARFGNFPDGSYGNGSAMRVAPLGAFLADTPVGTVVEQAARSAAVTHAHPQGVAGAVATALAAWHAARSRGGPAPDAAGLLGAIAAALSADSAVTRGLASARELPSTSPLDEAVDVLGNGLRVSCADTVPLALWLAVSHLDDYRGAVEKAVAAGGDTDTLAAIVGGIVAARVSSSGIPSRWREGLEPLPPPLEV